MKTRSEKLGNVPLMVAGIAVILGIGLWLIFKIVR
jgi:hypothetical protein